MGESVHECQKWKEKMGTDFSFLYTAYSYSNAFMRLVAS